MIKEGQLVLRQNISKSLLSNATDLNNPTVQIFLAKKLRLFDDTFNFIQTIQIEDNMYQEILKSGINVQSEFNKLLQKTIYHKEHKIANDIIIGLEEVKQDLLKIYLLNFQTIVTLLFSYIRSYILES